MFEDFLKLLADKKGYKDNNKMSIKETKEKKMKNPEEIIDLIIKKEKQEISLPNIINSEVNLLVFPFFALFTKGLRKKTETEYRDLVKRGDQKVEILWSVSANPKYGYPGPFDREVHKAIEQIITEILKRYGKIENPIWLGSLYSLCNIMGIKKYGGFQYREIRKALERIKTTVIKSEGSFYYKGKKQWISKVFSLYDGVVFKGEQLKDRTIADTNLLYLSDLYLQSLNSFYIKPIDYTYLQSLKREIASRLYEILGVKFYGLKNKKCNFICYRYSKLCQILPLTPFKQISRAKQQLDPAHDELKNTDFLLNYTWDKNSGRDWLIYYWPGERARKEMRREKITLFEPQLIEEDFPEPRNKSQALTKLQLDLIDQLVELNISKVVAEDLVKHTNQQAIERWIKGIRYTDAKDKAAYLVKAIRENWQVPEECLEAEESERKRKEQEKIKLVKDKKEAEEQKKRQEEAQRLDRIYNLLSPSQQEEIKKEAEDRLPSFIRNHLKKQQKEGKLSKLVSSALREEERNIIKNLLSSGKIKEV